MSYSSETMEPCHQQQAIKAKCFHPTGSFIQFKKEEVEQSVPSRFQEIVRKHPHRIAVKFGNHTFSYDELNRASNRIAHTMLAQRKQEEETVALLFEQGAQVITALLGVLKTGKIYVPLDPAHPSRRLTSILEDSQAALVITNNTNVSLAHQIAPDNTKVINIDEIDPKVSAEDFCIPLLPDTLAYILYTSGSTGQPKGVIQNHRNVLHDCMSYTNNLHICPADRVGLLASVCVGASVHYLFGALLNGASLYPLDLRETGLTSLATWLIWEKITFFQLSANVFRYFLDTLSGTEEFPAIRLIALGSAQVTRKDVESFRQHFAPTCILLNRLSTTESNSIRWHFVDKKTQIKGDTLPVGYAVEDKEVLLLDETGTEVGINEVGEIAVRSRYLAPGYWRRPDLTQTAFLTDPEGRGKRIYRTGDLGRIHPDGCLEHLGRKDFRVKIRGFTVEVAEIEKMLLEYPNLKEAAVIDKDDKLGDKRLVAYIVADHERTLTINELRSFLKARLPNHMVPSAFVVLDALPLTASGKVDRNALSSADAGRPQLKATVVAAATSVEKDLTKIWAEVLRLERVGVHDNFFDLGGHSLLATVITSRIRDLFQVELPLRQLFETPTVVALAEYIETAHRIDQDEKSQPIQPVPRNSELPLSFAQQRLWFLHQLEPENPVYNQPNVLRLTGNLNVGALQKALHAIVVRHEVLRTSFSSIDGNPVQIISECRSVDLSQVDLTQLPAASREAEFQRLAVEVIQRPFNLSQDLMLRATLFRLGEKDHRLLLVIHHIASDGWSDLILFRELSAFYQAFSTGGAPVLPDLAVQYADFAVRQRRWLHGDAFDRQLTYWRNHLKNAPSVLELPADRPRPEVQTFRGSRRSLRLSKHLSDRLKNLSQREGVTLFMLLLAAFQTLLHRYTKQDHIVVGFPIGNRTRTEIEGLIGFFINTLALHVDLSDNPTFREVLAQVREICMEAYAHQDLPFEKLVEELQPKRELSRNPLVQVMFQLRNVAKQETELPDLRIEEVDFDSGTAKYDLALSVIDEAEGLRARLEYSTDLFNGDTIDRLGEHFQTLLEGIVTDPDQRICQLPLLTHAAQQKLLVEWNRTASDSFTDQCIHELFEAEVERSPDAVAVSFEESQLSYRELNHRANQLARYLQKLGVGPEVLVGISLNPCLEMVVGLLGILKAGGAYVPLDPTYPKERLAFMLRDARVPVLLTRRQLLDRLPEHNTLTVCLDQQWSDEIARESGANSVSKVTGRNSAYVIYTSGTTGYPKGVIVEHKNLANYLCWFNESSPGKKIPTLPVVNRPTFDASLKQLFAPLLRGGEVWILSDEIVGQPDLLLMALATRPRVGLNCVTSLWKVILDAIDPQSIPALTRALSCLLVGGERLDQQLVKRTLTVFPNIEFWNLYGPTETTANAIVGKASRDGPVTLGRPIAGGRIYILDSFLHPVPIGVAGELYIGGAGVARGYLNHVDLTAEKFIPNPFNDGHGERFYKTGDVVRYLANGNVEFLGRIDHQVKVRGFRVELKEIEEGLLQHPAVREALVAAREDAHLGTRLVAYVVQNSRQPNSHEQKAEPIRLQPLDACANNPLQPKFDRPLIPELHRFLGQKLPDYMVPSAFVFLDALPLTPNGKVDRKALPVPDQSRPELEEGNVAARSPVEEMIAEIWAELLKLDKVGVHDNFFYLGGHSLLAAQVISRLRQTFQIDLPLRSLFETSTVSGLAERIEDSQGREKVLRFTSIQCVARDGDLPLSFAQQRLWFLDQLEPNSAVYNIPSQLRLSGPLDITALEHSINEIVRRHEVLRTTFSSIEGVPAQVISPSLKLPLTVLDLSDRPEDERENEARRLATEEIQRPFELARGPLIRVRLLRLGDEEHVLLLTVHHIVSDGWSMAIFFRELSVLYESFCKGLPSPLSLPPIQYVDYAAWQREWLRGEVLEKQLSYWRNQLQNISKLELRTDRSRREVQSHRGARQSLELRQDLSEALRVVSRKEGVTPFMTLLAAFQTLLHHYTRQDDIAIGTPIMGRTRPEVEPLIGFFINTLVLRADLSGNPTFRELLSRVREVTLQAFTHQDLPFEKLVELLRPKRDRDRRSLVQVAFAFQNAPPELPKLPKLNVSPIPTDTGVAKLDLTLFMWDAGQTFSGALNYAVDLFDPSTIGQMIEHFQTLLAAVADNPEQRLLDLPPVIEQPRSELLEAIHWANKQSWPFGSATTSGREQGEI